MVDLTIGRDADEIKANWQGKRASELMCDVT